MLSFVALGAILLHVAFSAVVACWASLEFTHRLVNVRHLGSQVHLWKDLIASFLKASTKHDHRPVIVIIGSSFSWGYPWPIDDVYSSNLQSLLPDYKIVNLSIIGQDSLTFGRTLCAIEQSSTPISTILVEFSVANMKPDSLKENEDYCFSGSSSVFLPSYFAVLLTNPLGLSWLHIFWDEYNYKQDEREFSFVDLSDQYFPSETAIATHSNEIRDRVNSILEKATQIADRVVVYPAAMLREGIEMSQFDVRYLERATDEIMEQCRRHPAITCIDPTFDVPRQNFANLTHLNLRGHRFFANWLVDELRAAGVFSGDAGVVDTGKAAELAPSGGVARQP